MNCGGTWRDSWYRDDAGDAVPMICSGCNEIMVIINGRAFNFPPGYGVQDAVASAHLELDLVRGN